MIRLSKRLSAVAESVPAGTVLFDIGCDHGYVPVSLLSEGRIPFAVAADVRQGPLSAAREHAKREGVSERMAFILSDGLRGIEPAAYPPADAGELRRAAFLNPDAPAGPQDEKETGRAGKAAFRRTLLIAGMGGDLMGQILSAEPEKVRLFETLILSPQSDQNAFRHMLGKSGYSILKEKLVEEDGKYYFILQAARGEDTCRDETDYELGPHFLEDADPVHRSFLEKKYRQLDGVLRTHRIPEEQHKKLSGLRKLYKEALLHYEMP